MRSKVDVIQPGLFSTVQDMGRLGFLKFGVSLSGVMDQYASKLANLLVQNPANAAVLEITLSGPHLVFRGAAKIAVTGAKLSPELNREAIPDNTPIAVETGDELSFGRRVSGCRAYLSVSGGFKTEEVLRSQSWYEGITSCSRLEKKATLAFDISHFWREDNYAAIKAETAYLEQQKIAVFPGPEYHLLSGEAKERLQRFQFSVGKNHNRMAIQVEEKLANQLKPILTGPVIPGTVQLTPSGKLIILMRDCQTTGGYPRVLQISEDSMNVLAQKIMGDKIKFRLMPNSEILF